MKKYVSIIFAISMSLILVGCSNSINEVEDAANDVGDTISEDVESMATDINEMMTQMEESVDETFIDEGETAVINTDAFVALNEDAYKEIYDMIEADPYNDEISQLITEDEVIILDEGVQVVVLETGVTQARIKVVETGEVGYIHRSLISQL